MDVCIELWIYIDVWSYGCIDVWSYEYIRIDVWSYGYVYVCVCIYIIYMHMQNKLIIVTSNRYFKNQLMDYFGIQSQDSIYSK